MRIDLTHLWPSRHRRIAYQQRLLAMYRRLLHVHVAECAQWPPSDIPPPLQQAIRILRRDIHTCKGRLRGWHVPIADAAIDQDVPETFLHAVAHQRHMRTIHQHMLAILEQQYAAWPPETIPPHIVKDIHDRRAAIAEITSLLQGWGVPDESPIPSIGVEYYDL